MKKLFVLLSVGAVFALSAVAFGQDAGPKGQPGKGPGQGQGKPGEGRMRMGGGKRILDQLNLTADQKKKLEALRAKMREEMQKNFKDGKRPDPATMKAAFEKNQKEILAILTPEQQKKYKALLEEMKKKGFGAGPGARGGGKPGENKPGAKAGGNKGGGGQ